MDRWRRRASSALSGLVSLAILVTGIGAVAAVRAGAFPLAVAPGGPPVAPAAALAGAADAIERALAPGGEGLRFEVVSRTRTYARPDGPRLGLRDPHDTREVVAWVDELDVNAMTSRGIITADGFAMEMRLGPAPGRGVDWDAQPPIFAVIERDGGLWRTDGAGWYRTDVSPGMGMDPVSARLLARLVRGLAEPVSLGSVDVGGRTLAGVRGRTTIDDYPGIVASDGRTFTEPVFALEAWLDGEGRLVRLVGRARSLADDTYDLYSEIELVLTYGAPDKLPEPLPAMAPEPAPTSDPSDTTRGEVTR